MTEEPTQGVTRYRIAVLLLMLYATVFLALSLDLMTRVWSWRERMAPRDLAAVGFFEISRSVVTLLAIFALAWMLAYKTSRRWRPLAFGLGFAAIWHAKALAFDGFPGPLQEAFAAWLSARDVPRALTLFVFASPAWALWAAAGALLRFSVVFPQALTPAAVDAAVEDRTGLLRSSPLAGVDIGSVFRKLSAWLLANGWLRARPVTLVVIAWIAVFQWLGKNPVMVAISAVVLAVTAGLIVTHLRAGVSASTIPRDIRTITWLKYGATSGVILLMLSAASSFALTGAATFVGVVLLGVAPAAVILCCLFAVLPSDDAFRDE